jgi:cell division protein FtsQ
MVDALGERIDRPRFWWRGAEPQRPSEAAAAPSAFTASRRTQAIRPSSEVAYDSGAPYSEADDLIAESHAYVRSAHRGSGKRFALLAGAAVLCAGAFAIVTRAGLPVDGSASFSSNVDGMVIAAGLGVDEIRVSGHRYTLDRDIFAALALDQPTSLLRYSSEAARRRVENLSWVKQATVTRILPDTVEVKIVERTPVAVWLQKDAATLVDVEGRELAQVSPSTLPALPRISGEGAPEAVAGYLAAMASAPDLARRVTIALRVGQRRWSLDLDNGSRVLLPAEGEQAAIARLLRLANSTGVFVRPSVVDLRLEERIAVAPRTTGPTSHVAPKGATAVKSASTL